MKMPGCVALAPDSITKRSASGYGRGRSNTPLITVKIAVAEPIPTANVTTASRATPGAVFHDAQAWDKAISMSTATLAPSSRRVRSFSGFLQGPSSFVHQSAEIIRPMASPRVWASPTLALAGLGVALAATISTGCASTNGAPTIRDVDESLRERSPNAALRLTGTSQLPPDVSIADGLTQEEAVAI